MHIDTAGTYTLQYTAEDSCGNETIEERTVEVVSLRTVLYTDGTFIINEKSTDQAANEALHGVATNVYDPFDPNGDTDAKKYIFTSSSNRPWYGEIGYILYIEIGENISPTSTAHWFSGCVKAETIDMSNLDTNAVTNMESMFRAFGQTASTQPIIDLSQLDTSNVTNMSYMFYAMDVASLDVSSLDTSKVTDMHLMFGNCKSMTSLDLSTFNTSSVMNMQSMFSGCRALTSLDLSSFDTSSVENMSSMFQLCGVLTTIYASASFVVDQVTNSNAMFNDTTALVGGAGTTWSSSKTNKEYARIDNPPDAPGYFTAKA